MGKGPVYKEYVLQDLSKFTLVLNLEATASGCCEWFLQQQAGSAVTCWLLAVIKVK